MVHARLYSDTLANKFSLLIEFPVDHIIGIGSMYRHYFAGFSGIELKYRTGNMIIQRI